ncbi:hypothetical protein BDZ94DRAFT_1325212 [Collybia nuda]|uniref:Nephrocystin 3-like N-terminal domain-containing protein n=1 Tax=Collybia nuda TaxID=64659 RepID=A0A9P6CE62_9AGAR|nr:hypothetical protein BDZ94DRAFT_1325212 [Collybia nuda]
MKVAAEEIYRRAPRLCTSEQDYYPSPKLSSSQSPPSLEGGVLGTMPFFPNATQPYLDQCNLYDIGGHLIVNHEIINDAQQGIIYLSRKISTNAFYNSEERFPQPRCHNETRHGILGQMVEWIEGRINAQEKQILWIYGPAGAGKSAIAQTLCEIFSQRQALTASFFVRRGDNLLSKVDCILATIVYQLVKSIPEIRDDIGRAIAHDPTILSLCIEVQIRHLIVEPFLAFLSRSEMPSSLRYLVIIDGIDECISDENQSRLILHIAELIYAYRLPFTFVVASRPEPHIRNAFHDNPQISMITQYFELNPSDKDICAFLHHSFQKMRTTHPCLRSLNKTWPSQTELDILVYRSSGYFIYASTVIKFIGDEDMNPLENLEHILSRKSTPLSALDDIYHQILSTISPVRKPTFLSILEILMARGPIQASKLEKLLGLPEGDMRVIFRRMHSLLWNIDSECPVEFVHASFQDFLGDKERSGIFYANPIAGHATIAKSFLKQAGRGVLFPELSNDWLMHAKEGYTELNPGTFIKDLQAVNLDIWKQYIETWYIDMWYFDICCPLQYLACLINDLEDVFRSFGNYLLHGGDPLNPAQEVLEKLASLLDHAYESSLKSEEEGCLEARFLGESTEELVYDPIIRHGPIGAKEDDDETSLLKEFLLKKSSCKIFPTNSAAHEKSFTNCVRELGSTRDSIDFR